MATRDYNASYWDERFTSDVGKAAGGAVKSHLAKVLTAGKYRVVLRDAACSGEDNELEATWAALTPADVVEDAAVRSKVVAFYDLDHTVIDTNSNKHWIAKEVKAGREAESLRSEYGAT